MIRILLAGVVTSISALALGQNTPFQGELNSSSVVNPAQLNRVKTYQINAQILGSYKDTGLNIYEDNSTDINHDHRERKSAPELLAALRFSDFVFGAKWEYDNTRHTVRDRISFDDSDVDDYNESYSYKQKTDMQTLSAAYSPVTWMTLGADFHLSRVKIESGFGASDKSFSYTDVGFTIVPAEIVEVGLVYHPAIKLSDVPYSKPGGFTFHSSVKLNGGVSVDLNLDYIRYNKILDQEKDMTNVMIGALWRISDFRIGAHQTFFFPHYRSESSSNPDNINTFMSSAEGYYNLNGQFEVGTILSHRMGYETVGDRDSQYQEIAGSVVVSTML